MSQSPLIRINGRKILIHNSLVLSMHFKFLLFIYFHLVGLKRPVDYTLSFLINLNNN